MQHRFLAGSLHTFTEWNFGLAEFSQVLDIIFGKLHEIVNNPDLFLEYMFGNKKPVVSNAFKVQHLGELREELFFPQDINNRNSNDLTKAYGAIACQRWIIEFTDKNKAMHLYLSSVNGPQSYLKIPKDQRIQLLQKFGTSDPAEMPFGHGSHQLKQFPSILYGNASGVAHAKQNKDFDYNEYSKDSFDGSFHQLTYQEKASLIVLCL